ncbi:hypothetical protein A6K24_13725 [Metabacillus litoralis]|uniref:Uncharacterized protein n=1 Tax=Metabacillus litoralis TaxID=152268 RepID=A0A179SP84_9BACI|nr:hypothetical protein A6K24_13725 [Metabacillus litoralis]
MFIFNGFLNVIIKNTNQKIIKENLNKHKIANISACKVFDIKCSNSFPFVLPMLKGKNSIGVRIVMNTVITDNPTFFFFHIDWQNSQSD